MIIIDILDESILFRHDCPIHGVFMISASQCRAARGLLDWSQQDLAKRSGVGIVTIRQLESGIHQPRRATLSVVRQSLETAGVEFIDENGGGAGVRLKKAGAKPPKAK
jgi:transcriptional regulator with XRE-family HTH domain